MKAITLSIVALIAFANVATSQTKTSSESKTETAKVIVLVNTASWCGTCRANGQRVKENVISQYMKNEKCHIVVNDLSDDASKEASKEKCEKAGITAVAENNKATGVIYFIHSETKEVLAQVSVAKTDDEIKKVFEETLAKI